MALQQRTHSLLWILLLSAVSIRSSDTGNQTELNTLTELSTLDNVDQEVVRMCLEEARFNSSLGMSLASSTASLKKEIQEVREKILEAYRENLTKHIFKEDLQTQLQEMNNALMNTIGSEDVQFVKLQIFNVSETLQAELQQTNKKFSNLVDKTDFHILNNAIHNMSSNENFDLMSLKIDGLSTKQMINNLSDLASNINSNLIMISNGTLKGLMDNIQNDIQNNSLSLRNMHEETMSHFNNVTTTESIEIFIEQIGTLATNKSVQDILNKISYLPTKESIFKLNENISNDVQLQEISNKITENFGNLEIQLSDLKRAITENADTITQMLSNTPEYQVNLGSINGQTCNFSEPLSNERSNDRHNEELENILSQYLSKNEVIDGVDIIDLVVISLVAIMIILLCIVLKLLCSIKSKVSNLEHQRLHKSYYEQGSPLLSRMSTNGTLSLKRPHLDLSSITEVSKKAILQDSHL